MKQHQLEWRFFSYFFLINQRSMDFQAHNVRPILLSQGEKKKQDRG